jgi:hypothetical protein
MTRLLRTEPLDPLDIAAVNAEVVRLFPMMAHPIRYREPRDGNERGPFLDDVHAWYASLGYRNFRLEWNRSGSVSMVPATGKWAT